MKKIALILLVLVLGTLLAGCVTHEPAVSEPLQQYNSYADIKPPEDMSWINPGKVMVTGFYPGARAESTLLLYNGNEEAATFNITFRQPDSLEDGYALPPSEALGWITVDKPLPTLEPKEVKPLLIVLEMPEGAVSPERWEFWISVFDTTQGSTVITELASRWLITMRD